jgi:hypothetical protein
MKPPLNNELSETAVLLIKATYRDHARTLASSAATDSPFLTHPRLGTHSPAGTQRQGCVLRMLSVADAYVDIVLETALRAKIAPAPPAVEVLLTLALPKLDTWGGRNEFANMFGLSPLSGFSRWSQVKAASDARNSIAHGLGSLTRKQNDATKRSLRDVKVAVTDGQLRLTDGSVEHIRDLIVAFIEHLDHAYGQL